MTTSIADFGSWIADWKTTHHALRTTHLALVLVAALGCGRTRDMPEKVEMRDSMPVIRAMKDMKVADSMLDTIPGGKMARGDSAASMKLLKKKM